MAKYYDVLIVGAGPAGSAAAFFLATGGLRVALLDKSTFPRDKTCGDGLTPRAVKMLGEMGVLPQIAHCAYSCSAITIRHSDEINYRIELSSLAGLPHNILVLPRLKLDHILLEYAIAAGAEFISGAKVNRVSRRPDAIAQVETEGRMCLDSKLVILATGSNTLLLREQGLLQKTPPKNLAARTYFENVDGLDDSIVLFFDGLDLPGYGWVFPSGSGTANIGCGVFFDAPNPQPSQLRDMVQQHPYLKRILRNARQLGPIKGYPLRTDFSPSNGGNDWIFVVGEALGLVNPLTGEGIDYALESAQVVAQTILGGWDEEWPSKHIQRKYRTALAEKFQMQMMIGHLGQRIYFRNGVFNRLIARAESRTYLRRAILNTCFGASNPAALFGPRALWNILGP